MEPGSTPPGLAVPSLHWSGNAAFRRAAGALGAAERLAFQRQSLPYLRLLFKDLNEAYEMGVFDAGGADHYSFDSDGDLDVVIQCKGFSVTPAEVGASQARQCAQSIGSFRSANKRARIYLLLHNRDNRNPTFTEPVLAALTSLQDSGLVVWAGLWGQRDLLIHACQELYVRAGSTARGTSVQAMEDASTLLEGVILNEVPFSEYELIVTNNGLEERHRVNKQSADPVPVLRRRERGVSLLLGSFGYGKTTIAIRTVASAGLNALFLPAARLGPNMTGFRHIISTVDDTTLASLPEEDQHVLEPLVRVAVERLVTSPQDDLALVIDGLDEAPKAGRRNGLITILDGLKDARIPVIVTMRSEFWDSKRTELNASLLGVGPQSYGRYLRVVDLLPWDADEILVFLDRQCSAATSKQQDRIQQFRDVVTANRYDQYYGDIPRRPLFLRMVIDDVLAVGVRPRSRVELFDSWITNKLFRDWYSPTQMGGEGRAPIISRDAGVDDDIRTARRIMLVAARMMITQSDSDPELTGDVSVDELRTNVDPPDAEFDVTALSLNSLLVPIGDPSPGRPLRLMFAHRAFQEFFLAESFLRFPDPTSEAHLPDAVLKWLQEMRATDSS